MRNFMKPIIGLGLVGMLSAAAGAQTWHRHHWNRNNWNNNNNGNYYYRYNNRYTPYNNGYYNYNYTTPYNNGYYYNSTPYNT